MPHPHTQYNIYLKERKPKWMREKHNNTHKKGDRDESNSLHIIHSRAALSTRSPLSITRLTWMQTWCYTKERAALISSSLNQCLLWGDKEEEWLSLKTGEDVCYRACTWPDTRSEISTFTQGWEACLWKFLRNNSYIYHCKPKMGNTQRDFFYFLVL